MMITRKRFELVFVGAALLCVQGLVLGQQEAQLRALAVQAQAAAAQNDEAKEAYEQLLESIRKREQFFLMRLCKLDAQQEEEATKFGKALKAELAKDAKQGQDNLVVNGRLMRQGQIRIRMGNNQIMADRTIVTTFRKKLQEGFKKVLKPEQLKTYDDELDARIAFKHRANAECLVAILDQKLSLTPDQVQPLIESLKGWEEADELQLSFYLQQSSENYVPPIPLKFYANVLTQAQRKLFEGAQQVGVQKNYTLDVDSNGW